MESRHWWWRWVMRQTDEAEEERINRRTAEPGGDGEEEGECIGGMEVSEERGCI